MFTLISNHRPASVLSSTIVGEIANRSCTPTDVPLWLNSGVTSGGRNVFIVRCSILRGNSTTRPPSVCRGESTPSMRVNESKLVSRMSRLAGQALHRIVDVAELDVLREEQPVPFQRPADREPRLEPAHAAEASCETAA